QRAKRPLIPRRCWRYPAPTRALNISLHDALPIYKGLAIASTAAGDRLYATNFRAGTVEVFDAGFHPVLAGFTDADTGWNPASNTDRKSTRLNSSHDQRSYAGSCL